MGLMLRVPGLQNLVGRSTALITFTGRSTGKVFTTPVTYARHGEEIILIAHESRKWWRNLTGAPMVQLRLAGRDAVGSARILRDQEALPPLIEYLSQRAAVARASGVSRDKAGNVNPTDAEAILADTVVIVVDVAAVAARGSDKPASGGDLIPTELGGEKP